MIDEIVSHLNILNNYSHNYDLNKKPVRRFRKTEKEVNSLVPQVL